MHADLLIHFYLYRLTGQTENSVLIIQSYLTTTHVYVNAPYFTSTPTVRGHAEACPSTTYSHSNAVAARCRCFFTQWGKLRGWGGSLTRFRGIGSFNRWKRHKKLGSRKLAIRFGWNLAHVPPSARWRWFPTDVLLAKHFLLTKITVFGVKFSTFFKFHLISRHGYTLALPNLADESLQTVSGMLCEIFSSIGLKLEEI